MLKKLFVLVLLVVFAAPTVSFAQDATPEAYLITDPAIVWTAGLRDADNSVFYSVLLAAGPQDLNNITLTSTLPEGATFVENAWVPQDATFVGQADGVVTYTLSRLTAETLIGPFAYHVTFANSDAADFAPPAFAAANAAWDGGAASYAPHEGALFKLADTATIDITPEGTSELTPVGDTGIWINVPAGAVSAPTTLSFTRLPIADDTPLPQVADDTWWCALVSVTASTPVTFSQPITLVFPTRKLLPPGAPLDVFSQSAGSSWDALTISPSTELQPRATAYTDAKHAYIMLDVVQFSGEGQIIAVGIRTEVRASGTSAATKETNFVNANIASI